MTKTNDLKQSIGLTGIQNARELGGYLTEDHRIVKRGVLLRTAKLSTGTEEDLGRLKEEFRLAKILDLRSDEEVNGSPIVALFSGSDSPEPDPVLEGVAYIHAPILDMRELAEYAESRMDGDPDNGLAQQDQLQLTGMLIDAGLIGDEIYIGFLDGKKGKQGYSRLFRELLSLEEGRAVLFHCSQGKDRTGLAAMLILTALGVSEEIIVEDYMLTNEFYRERIAKERKMLEMSGKVPPDRIEVFLMVMDAVRRSSMTNVIAHLKERYGSVMDYIVGELGVSKEQITQLRDRFLESAND